MAESLQSENAVRQYLLGRVSDETTLEGIEELLFTDEEFCAEVALAEDGLINDYILGRLDDADAESFRATLANNPERRFKLELTQALRAKALARNVKTAEGKPLFFASLKAFFRQPMYAGAFAVLIAVVGLAVYLTTRSNPDNLAELRAVYQKARPTETRISEFGYAPFPQLRGAPEPAEQTRLRRIEISLIEATEKNPSAQTHHALGVYYLTQQKYPAAIKEFESALKLADKDPQIHNDLGSAHFELAKSGPKGKKVEELAQSLEEFTKATELDGNLLEALFNRSFALQEMDMPREAKKSWTLYLQKDSSSPWAEEARKNLARIQGEQTLFRTDQDVLSDFLTAFRNHDDARAQKIHNETKGVLKSVTVPLQLSRRYLLAKQRGDEAERKESLEALTFIGKYELTQTGDSFFFELANFYASAGTDKTAPLLEAQDAFANGQKPVSTDEAQAISQLEKTRDLFARLGDEWEASIAETWAAQLLPDVGKVAESRPRLAAIIANAESRNFIVLLSPAYYALGMGDYKQNRISESARNLKSALRWAEAGNNTFEIQHAEDSLRFHYSRLGELEPAQFYASKMFSDKALYYQSQNQYLRDKGTLADLLLKLKFVSTSLSLSKESLSVAQEIRPPDNSHVNDSLRHLVRAAAANEDSVAALRYANDSMQVAMARGDSAENTGTKADIYRLLADIKRQSKNCREALADYDQALELYRSLPELTVSSYQIHKGKLFCFQQLNQQEQFAGELRNVTELSEEYRHTIREDNSRQAFFENEQDVFDAAIENGIREHHSREAFALVEASQARSLLEFVESAKSIAEVENDFAAVARPLSLPDIQARLPEQVQLVQYAVLPERLAIWIISKTRFDLIEKQITAAELEKKIAAYQASIVGKGPPAEIRRAGEELYGLLIPPDLVAGKQLCLVPDKSLHQLSFATLVSPAGEYLLQDYALFYAPSASILVLASENARRKEQVTTERLLSIGNPDFDREDNPNLADLRDAEAEAKVVAASYEQPLLTIGSDATKEKFLLNFANVDVVHFAGHFVTNQQSPGNSKLLFAGGELRSNQLSAYKLPKAKLVVLSACETGIERYNKSEGAIGIARTLLALGAPVVVASQWKVDSEPTKDLMIAFHRNRKQKGMPSAESLRRAQLELLSRPETQAPFYWAAFSLFGGYANY
jgi:CHAT domain-containing protein